MSEVVFLQIGQCGNQIGWKFWEQALAEHRQHYAHAAADDSYKSFFEIGDRGSFSNPSTVRARAVLIDSEEGCTAQLQKSDIRDIFRGRSVAVDIGGAGNNWAKGYFEVGTQEIENVMDKIRQMAEHSNRLEAFFMLYSLGGGTGSGFGSLILEKLTEIYPDVWKMATVVCPTDDDPNVVTSPYNSALSASHLCKFADCVFPVENAALERFATGEERGTTSAYDKMNGVVADFLLDLTAGSRFSGRQNVDLLEIKTNLIPFPNHKFLTSGLSPIILSNAPRSQLGYFEEAMSPKGTLCDLEPFKGNVLASAFLVRGQISQNEVRNALKRVQMKVQFTPWNSNGWKIGLCSYPPLKTKMSVNCLTNSDTMTRLFEALLRRFKKLYASRAFISHFTDYLTVDDFDEAQTMLEFLKGEYESVREVDELPPRPRIVA